VATIFSYVYNVEIYLIKSGYYNVYHVEIWLLYVSFSLLFRATLKFWLPNGYMVPIKITSG
jgi:hypothetical protein